MDHSRSTRAVAGAALGLAVTLVGSIGPSVAGQSGNTAASGSDGDHTTQSIDAGRGAASTWYRVEDTGEQFPVRGTKYIFGVWIAEEKRTEPTPAEGIVGGVYANLDECSNLYKQSTCTRRTWRGELNLDPGATGLQAFEMDERMTEAHFQGSLVETTTGEQCSFDVDFTATGPPMRGSRWTEWNQDEPEQEHVLASESMTAFSDAVLTSDCFPTLTSSYSDAFIWRNIRWRGDAP